MTIRLLRNALALPLVLALGACGGEEKADPRAERDGVVANALDDPIMADPDLASQNRGDAALSGGGPATAEIPPDKRTPEEAERARLAAHDLLGRKIEAAPLPAETLPESRLVGAVTMQGVAEKLELGGKGCPARMSYSFDWAARMPAALPVYPRGHARVAAGADEGTCHIRVVRIFTPVPVNEVVDFYHAAASKAGLAPQIRREGDDQVVAGGKGAARFYAYVRQYANGLTEVDLATSGF
jgi:hypothetical protein